MMMKHTLMRFGIIALVAASLLRADLAWAAEKFLTIGTGGITGVYYPAGGAICRLVNRGRKDHGIRCSVESTSGSVFNLTAIRKEQLDLGIVQSDWQFHAHKGSSVFASQGPNPALRAVFSMHSEPFTVVASDASGIKNFDDLKGKKVNIGQPGSGNRATMDELMRRKGWSKNVFTQALEIKPAEQAAALCSGKIDAFIYSAGNPNGVIQEAAMTCPVHLVPVEGGEVDALIKENPFYAVATIPANMYPGTKEDTKTFGVKATLVANAGVDEDMVYQLVKAVFENFDNFKTLHPVFSTLDPKQMVQEGNTAPFHPGALRYYKEQGWVK